MKKTATDMEHPKESPLSRYRYWIILGSVLLFLPPLSLLFQFIKDIDFCGTWCPRMFFVWKAGTSGKAYFIGFLKYYAGALLVFGILASTFLFGRHWCSHLCPIGGSMELVSRLVPKFLKVNYSFIPAPAVRYGFLTAFLLAPAFGIGSLCCNYCNFAAVPRLFGASFSPADMAYFLRTAGLINLGLVVLFGFHAKGGRGYCNLLCPIGAMDAVSSRLGQNTGRRIRVSAAGCKGCGSCREVCPLWAVEMKDGKARIDQISCIPCRICEKTCPNGAIGYGRLERK